MPEADLDQLRARWPLIAKEVLGPLLTALTIAQHALNGDVQRFLVLLVVAMRTFEHPEYAQLSYEEVLGPATGRLPSLGTNTRSIACALDLPKETVRRKVEALIQSGWIIRAGRKLELAPPNSPQAHALGEALLRLAQRSHRAVDRAIASGPGVTHRAERRSCS